ncbi:MAG TPA: hypothetical protein VKI17_00745, partial [Gemmataceae bacterium]|nr:hypothetical protein [Gemmataceae bacterium]
PEAVVRAKDKIFDPKAERRANVYPKLSQAIDDAQQGDTILIRRNGQLAIDPVELKRADADLTIKPYEGYRPVLKIGQSTDPDAALFRLHDGKLTLENLEFVVSPDRAGYKALSVVMVMGDGQCVVKDCVATLRDDYGTPLSFLTLSDPSMVMKMGQANGQQQVAGISISGSVVRGNGQFLTVRVSRPFELRAEDSLIALTGSFLLMEGNPKDAMARGTADITLNHLTTYLTDQLFLLRAIKQSGTNLKGLVNTQVRLAADCIFASATGKPLVHLDGVDSEEQMKYYFSWQESKHNAFSHVTTYLDQVPAATNEMAPPAYNEDAWKTFTRDVNGLFALVRFQNAPGPDAPMWKVIPADFKTRADSNLAGCGANIERLPKPSDENDTAGRANAFPDD